MADVQSLFEIRSRKTVIVTLHLSNNKNHKNFLEAYKEPKRQPSYANERTTA